MSRTHHHKKGDCSAIKKNKSGSKAFPRKEWKEGALFNKYWRKKHLSEQVIE